MKKQLNQELKAAFADDLKDAVRDFTVVRKTLTDDDWLENGGTVSERKFGGAGIFTDFNAREIDGETIKQGDVRLIVLLDDNEPLQLDDVIDGMQVVNVATDAVGVTQTVQLRG